MFFKGHIFRDFLVTKIVHFSRTENRGFLENFFKTTNENIFRLRYVFNKLQTENRGLQKKIKNRGIRK